jgi:hypothetical protein
MAGPLLTHYQKRLWRQAIRRDGLRSMSIDDLTEWLRVCVLMAEGSDSLGAAKARRMWNDRRREVEAEVANRP